MMSATKDDIADRLESLIGRFDCLLEEINHRNTSIEHRLTRLETIHELTLGLAGLALTGVIALAAVLRI